MRVPILGISRLPLGSLKTKCHLGVGPMAKHKIYNKGKGGDFPQVRVVMTFVNLKSPVAHPSIKNALAMH